MDDDAFLIKLRELHNQKLYKEALKVSLEQEKFKPYDAKVLKAKAVFLSLTGNHPESVKAGDEAIKIDPNDPELHHNKGMGLYYLGKYADAINSFDNCLKFKPNEPICLQHKICSLIFLGKLDDAVKIYESKDIPEVFEHIWHNNLGVMYLGLKDYKKAGSFLYGAKALSRYEPIIYYNLSRLWWRLGDKIRFIKHALAYIVFSFVKNTGILSLRNLLSKRHMPHISESKYFAGPGTLFLSDSNVRETVSIFKLLRGPNMTALCNDTWEWFAVNIPYQSVEKNEFKGDIDIILKSPRFLGDYDTGFNYRGFQVKTVIVDQFGKIKSAKKGLIRHKKIKKQLDVLKKFGCEQVFFLELFVLGRGYSSINIFPSDEMRAEIIEKAKYLEHLGYGYVVMAEEPAPDRDDESGGMVHFPLNILGAKINPVGSNFKKLVVHIDLLREDQDIRSKMEKLSIRDQGTSHFGYCPKCKKLTVMFPKGVVNYCCLFCENQVF
ncbi:MAG: tetratricopeptide repeat protein [Candidatus Paceibacterota bacterium]|jgi:tetratricopeptide (TPR) repeat protein